MEQYQLTAALIQEHILKMIKRFKILTKNSIMLLSIFNFVLFIFSA
jgi:hypothetical protein